MLQYSKKLTLKCLHNICKINKIKYISSLNKNDILNLLNKTSAAKIIQKCVRYKFNFNIKRTPYSVVRCCCDIQLGVATFIHSFNTQQWLQPGPMQQPSLRITRSTYFKVLHHLDTVLY